MLRQNIAIQFPFQRLRVLVNEDDLTKLHLSCPFKITLKCTCDESMKTCTLHILTLLEHKYILNTILPSFMSRTRVTLHLSTYLPTFLPTHSPTWSHLITTHKQTCLDLPTTHLCAPIYLSHHLHGTIYLHQYFIHQLL